MGMSADFWRDKSVLVTGHTGFKGGWLALWLHQLGANVTGFALPSPTSPSFFSAVDLGDCIHHVEGDIRDIAQLEKVFAQCKPQIVFHLAAQSLVRLSYQQPVETWDTNVMGSLKILEAIRHCPSVEAAVMVTTDKCYRNNEWHWGYRECDPMGGHDPYSASKGAMELLVDSYRQSFFPSHSYAQHGKAIATARAGNVIGGGDWSLDRLLPDAIVAFAEKRSVNVRNPSAIRPWQHVLQPLHGYLQLAEALCQQGSVFAEGWNFGPREDDCQSVASLVGQAASLWGEGAAWVDTHDPAAPHEASFLKLDSSKAAAELGWKPGFDLGQALALTVEWYKGFYAGADMRELSIQQLGQV